MENLLTTNEIDALLESLNESSYSSESITDLLTDVSEYRPESPAADETPNWRITLEG